MTMSPVTIGSHSHQSPMIIMPAAGYAGIISPYWLDEKIPTRPDMDLERRWQAEWDRRNVED